MQKPLFLKNSSSNGCKGYFKPCILEAEKLETGSIAITKAIADITSQLEEYRLKQLDKQETRKEKALSKQERETAIQF